MNNFIKLLVINIIKLVRYIFISKLIYINKKIKLIFNLKKKLQK
jgi:hypothetical protein